MEIYYSNSYKIICDYYGNTKAKRSQIPYIHHINEGLVILNHINASKQAQEAFCLHPIFQIDKDLMENINRLDELVEGNTYLLMLVMEYRSVANEYLSPKGIWKAEDIRLSPIKDVNDMLIADKVQNRKDFELNKEKYCNKDILDGYFRAWLERLGITEDSYKELIALIA